MLGLSSRSRALALAWAGRSAGRDWLHATVRQAAVQLVVVVILATLFTFSLLRLFPGDVADAAIPLRHRRRRSAQFRKDNGLDKPFFEQYATWLGNLAQGDFGKDYQSNISR